MPPSAGVPDRGDGLLVDGLLVDGLLVGGLSLSRNGRAVLDRIAFTLRHRRLLAVVGPSGAGKSTLLALLAGLERPSSGSIRLGGRDITRLSPADRGVGMAFDDAALHEHLTIGENLRAAAAPVGEASAQRDQRLGELARRLGIATLLGRMPATLSAGERRRASLGRAFARAPALALLDEPFANLDRVHRRTMRRLVREMHDASGCATIVVSHDADDALAIADDLLVLVGGRLRAFGPAAEIVLRPPDLEVAQLVDDDGMDWIAFGPADAGAGESDLALPNGLRDCVALEQGLLIGIRPDALRIVARPTPSREAVRPALAEEAIRFTATVIGHERAGPAHDVLLRFRDGPVLRARTRIAHAGDGSPHGALPQELPIGTVIEATAACAELHLFAGAFPGRRIAADAGLG